ncbi:lytic transglycosylase [Streptomyces sp. D2-8]|uniref:lytic transglycosylase domain-containing protein n=1 Tax=Streptomyces sp. D2-8 TaxID=2707767 RepID=UPI0020BDE9D9|nr:lytic transglycosylase domain-containing protein [Streptomyces sp. D2-8]MCK8432426.1 lytic transglycosylase [Streptomyces sp. D2-8]
MAAQFGRRLRKGAATTAVAAVAVAALSASQAPGVNDHGRQTAADATPSPEASASDGSATGNSPYYTDLPPLKSPNPSPSTGPGPGGTGTTEAGIPATVLDAYKKAETALREAKPGCHLPWQLLAAIGRVESGQARGGKVRADGTTIKPILGPQLDGNGFALIKDTDDGAYDGNSSYDQAVGPMQFIPSTWAWAGRDGNGDGKEDPNNIYDAALAAGHYLCRNNWDLSDQGQLDRAILSYNNSRDYLNLVMRWLEYYRKGTHEVPDGTGTLPDNRSDDGVGASPTPTTPGTTAPGRSTPKPGPKPEKPEKPGKPGGGGTTTPKPPTTPPGTPTPPPTTPPTPTDTVDHLEDAGTAKLTAMAGDAFSRRISTRAETEAGKVVAKVRVRFTIMGDTDTTFTGGESVATVATNSSGVAVAPALQAGEKTGAFTVRATVVGRAVPGLDYKATVTERAADALARTGDAALTCAPGGEFANQVEVKATYQGAVADGVAATATLVKSADDPTADDKGPYFKDADGKTVRTLTGLKTDAKGLLKLPELYADDTTGTFLLRITTAGGATLTVELTVAAAETSSPSPSASPSA